MPDTESAVIKKEEKIEQRVLNIIDETRVTSFSDSIFAFAATLLVLKIDLPTIVENQLNIDLLYALSSLWPQYFANIISFLVIAFYWLNHHTIFRLVKKFNNTLVWINIVFLISLSFLPFPVDLYGDHFTISGVVAFYYASLSLVGFLLAAVWLYASDAGLLDKTLTKKREQNYTMQFLLAPIIFALSAPLAFVHPLLAQVSWLLVICGIVIINRICKA